MKFRALSLGIASMFMASSVFAQAISPIPQVSTIQPTDIFQDIVGGYPQAQNYYASSTLLGNYAFTQAGAVSDNALIGGDAGTNLFQRGTTVTLASPAAAAYTADRWVAWGGTNTPVVVSQQTAAADTVPGFQASFRVAKTSGAGVVQSCIAQQVATQDAIRFQGQTAEFSFYAKANSGFSPTNANIVVYIQTGTGTDESSTNAAFSLNAGGGGSTPWTGPVKVATQTISLSTAGFNRYAVSANIPATATELMVAICNTSIGTGTANDWYEFTGAQLVTNPALTATTVTGGTLYTNDARTKAFNKRAAGVEAALQQRYFYNLAEPATGIAVANGVLSTTTNCMLSIPLPVTMFKVPTFGTTGTLSTSTWKIQDSTTSTLASTFLGLQTGHTVNALNVNATLTTASTAGWACQLQGAGGTSSITATSEL